MATRWVTSNWRFEDLNGKRVEFDVQINNESKSGLGRFQLYKNEEGKYWILIQGARPQFDEKLHFALDQRAVETITRAGDSSQAEFVCHV